MNQVIAIEKGIKARVYADVTEWHKKTQKPALFNGFSKTYLKKDDESEDLPPEKQHVQFHIQDVLTSVEKSSSELFDVVASKDWTNQVAKADVVVDGSIIIGDVPVSFLLFLEKQLTDLRTFVEKIPVLDEVESWTLDPNSGQYRTEATKTHRTKKVQRPIVLYPATPEHPAQTQLLTEDVIVGYWSTVKQSGALPKPQQAVYLEHIEKLIKAVKVAREAANMEEAVAIKGVGDRVFSYIFD